MVFQGNLDPSMMLSEPKVVFEETQKMIRSFGKGRHIVNLGHGVLPYTKVDAAKAFVEAAQSFRY